MIESDNQMRESDREFKRGGFPRFRHEQSHWRSFSPEERTNRGFGEDWHDVQWRRGKAFGQEGSIRVG